MVHDLVTCSWTWGRCERSPLQQVETAAGERPLEVVAAAENLVAAEREGMKRGELCVVEAEHVGEPLRDVGVACAALRVDAYGNILQPRDSCDDGTVTRQAEPIRDHQTRYDGLAEAPGCLDQELVRPVDGITAEENASAVRVDQLLYDDAHSRLAGQPEALSVRER